MIGINRGFTSMIPQHKQRQEVLFGHKIRFTLFNKVFELSFHVTDKGEKKCQGNTKLSSSQKLLSS